MKREQIGTSQLFILMVAFQIGSSLIFPLGSESGQNAWLAALLGMLFGILVVFVFLRLFSHFQRDSLIQIILGLLGRGLGVPLCLTYIIYFTYQASRVVRDFSELLAATILVDTPQSVIIVCFIAVIIYTLRGGIEVFGRMAEMVFPFVMIVMGITWFTVYASGAFKIRHLTPIMFTGSASIWREAFPELTVLPYGELIVFIMVWPFLGGKGKLSKISLAAVLTGGLLLTINILAMLAVLGPELYGILQYPLLASVRMVSIGDFLERIDAVVILLMVAGGFFKIGVYVYGAALGTAHLFKLKSPCDVMVPLGAIIAPFSLVMAENSGIHSKIGLGFDVKYVHLTLQIIIPSLLLLLSFLKLKKEREP
ncbi:GerAB/ArcD/ProY family transporter [Paenibacillus sp. URB8-2]|uniref:GerAB/ArcD/ProY family transporter n=1 Tax=Paenibacillus sp. URB8-2 TaxID=2741301 RepID=UPI0015BECF9B|nr:GerAB/ArcD/ProY family transporter [Paenibacillus sp. URB8-2]BCG59832.1 spore germination protein KB [Paenibacillus sp. URB8-2]